GQLLTGDHNLVNLQAVIHYNVGETDQDLEDFVLHKDRVDGQVARAAEAVMAEGIAGRAGDDGPLHGKAGLPASTAEKTQERLLPDRLGVRIQDASVTHLTPPAQVQSAFDEVTRAQTGIRTAIYQAEQEANSRIREAEAERFRIQRLTAAYTHE